jgi:hypothetical protein
MSLICWLQNRTVSRSPRGRSQPRPTTARFRPQLEALEGRCVPSTLKVTNNYDNGTYPGALRYEIAQAQSNDTIIFDFGSKKANSTPHTITLTEGELVINKNLTITGPGANELTITSQPYVTGSFETENGSRIFEVDGAATTVALSGLTMTKGGGTRWGGSTGISYDGYGGAILNFSRLTVSACTLGGSTLATNYAQYGGAIANFGTMTVTACDVSDNRVYGNGFDADGGGIYNAGTLTVSGGDVSSNSFASYGGGIYNAGTATVSACTLSANGASYGGGIYNAATMTVSGCTLSGNSAGAEGGGIYNAGTAAALTVLDSLFSSNSPNNIYGSYTDGGGNTFH